jgi:FkbM family methyltransferase
LNYSSQHHEDETIHKLLGYPESPGFYIDVGAFSPTTISVTKEFYDVGWSGINIEPLVQYFFLLQFYRPRDINLNLACGHEKGILELWLNDGLTTAVPMLASPFSPKMHVPMETLTHICDTYVNNRVIDFLKIDVEGYEKQVLSGLDLTKYRPKCFCIEATLPCTTVENHAQWEPLLLNADYRFICKDLVNRYYLPI